MQTERLGVWFLTGVIALAYLVMLVGSAIGWWKDAEYPAPTHSASRDHAAAAHR